MLAVQDNHQKMKVLHKPQFRFALIVLLPILAWYFLFAFRPLAQAFRIALVDYQLMNPTNSPWVGLVHFKTILTSYKLFYKASINTAIYSVMINVGTVPLAILFAYALTNIKRGKGVYQWALFLPVVVSMSAVALLWRFMMDQQGIFNHVLISIGLPPSKWLAGPLTALPSIALVTLWKGLGGNIVLFAAGMLSIPIELYDAARVDGANAWQSFWKITLPLLNHITKLVIILVTISSLQAYTSAIILTGGGPARRTFLISQFIVEEAFSQFRFGLASAAAFVLFTVILAITLLQLRMMRTEWEY